MSRTVDLYLWLYGNPVFSLSYSDDNSIPITTMGQFTDITGYRPDPRDILSFGKKYKARGEFKRKTNYNGEDIWILKKIEIDNINTLVYIR